MRQRIEPDSTRHRARSRGFAALVAGLVALGFAAMRAGAAEAGDIDRWVPSLSFSFDAARQKSEGSVSSGFVMGPPLPPYGTGCFGTGGLCPTSRTEAALIDHPDQGSDTSVAPVVGAALELMTPRLLHGLLDPRLFVHADGMLAFGFERNLAGRGRPGPFTPPISFPRATDVEEGAVPGQGSRARWQLEKYPYGAGAGVAFTFTLLQRTFRFKPSFEWIEVKEDFIGVTDRVIKLRSPSPPASGLTNFRPISLTKIDKRMFDAIGPGVELEIDTARLGPIQTSVYVSGRFYHFLSSLNTTLSATNQYGETATWTFQPERWLYRAGAGFRLRWAPEPE